MRNGPLDFVELRSAKCIGSFASRDASDLGFILGSGALGLLLSYPTSTPSSCARFGP